MAFANSTGMTRQHFAFEGRPLHRAGGWVTGHLWLALPILAGPALWPLWSRGVPQSADGLLHLFRLMLLDRHVREGAFFPRWIPELMVGHGYPVFNFYASSTAGYDLALPPGGLHAGDQVTVTLYFRSQSSTEGDYTRFLHLQSPELGMAAQHDSLPQAGKNPTWAWVPGEIIADQAVLTIASDTPPGSYSLSAGLYDAHSGGVRVPARDGKGRSLPNNHVILTELKVE